MRPVLLYDPDCGFCTKASQLARRVGIRADVLPIGGIGTEHLGVDAERAETEIPYINVRGTVVYGAPAIIAALRACPPPLAAAGWLLAPFERLLQPLYRLAARNRHRLPGGTATCRLEDAPARGTSQDGRTGEPR